MENLPEMFLDTSSSPSNSSEEELDALHSVNQMTLSSALADNFTDSGYFSDNVSNSSVMDDTGTIDHINNILPEEDFMQVVHEFPSTVYPVEVGETDGIFCPLEVGYFGINNEFCPPVPGDPANENMDSFFDFNMEWTAGNDTDGSHLYSASEEIPDDLLEFVLSSTETNNSGHNSAGNSIFEIKETGISTTAFSRTGASLYSDNSYQISSGDTLRDLLTQQDKTQANVS